MRSLVLERCTFDIGDMVTVSKRALRESGMLSRNYEKEREYKIIDIIRRGDKETAHIRIEGKKAIRDGCWVYAWSVTPLSECYLCIYECKQEEKCGLFTKGEG